MLNLAETLLAGTYGVWYLEVRERVAVSQAKLVEDDVCYLGHVYEGTEGRYKKYYLPCDIENLAKFICNNEKNKLIFDSNDNAVLCTIGEYVDCIQAEKDVMQKLYNELKKYQGKKLRPDFSEIR